MLKERDSCAQGTCGFLSLYGAGVSEPVTIVEPVLSGVRGHAVVLAGRQRFAIWQVSPTGQPSGAHVEARERLESDTDRSRAILSTLERRALVSIDPEAAAAAAASLAHLAGLDLGNGWFAESVLDLGSIWSDIVAARHRYEEAAGQALDWPYELADASPSTLSEYAQAASVRERHDDPVIGEALLTSDILRWLVSQWADTETVRWRRKPLRDAFGPPAVLSPNWLATLQHAYTKVLPL